MNARKAAPPPPRPSQRPPSRRATSASSGSGSRPGWWIAIGVLAASVVVAVVVLVVINSGSGSSSPAVINLVQIQPVTVSGTALAPLRVGQADQALGANAPRLSGRTFGSRSISLKPGKPTMVVVVSYGDTYSRSEVPQLVQWHHSGLAPFGLDVLTVVTGPGRTNPSDPPSSWLVREEWPWPVLVDDQAGSAAGALGASDSPQILLIDAHGVVRYRRSGLVAATDLAIAIHDNLGL